MRRPVRLRVFLILVAASGVLASACDSSSPVGADLEAGVAGKGRGGANGRKAAFSVTPSQVDFGTSGTSTSITLKNSGNSTLSWTATENAGWLTLGAVSGSIPRRSSQTVSLSVSRGGLSAGAYGTTVKFVADGNSTSVPVSMTVGSSGSSGATLSVSPDQVDFGTSSTSASVTVTNNGDTSLSWTASDNAAWLSLGATSGTVAAHSSKTVSLSAQRTGMSEGTYTARLIVAAGATVADTTAVSMTVSSGTSVLLAGQVIDQFGGQGLGGLTVEYRGSTAVTDGSGRFSIAGSPTSALGDLTLSGPGVYTRRTFARTGDDRWRIVPASFDMSAFDDVAREEFGPATVRWTSAPTVYVDTRPEGFSDGPELQRWIVEVRNQVAGFVSEWSGSEIAPANVVVTSNPPRDQSAGTIVIHFSEDDSRYGGSSSPIGYTRLSWSREGVVSGAAIWLRYVRYSGDAYASKRRGILGHELGHGMGMGHMNRSTYSLMQPSIGGKTDLSPFDLQAAPLLYTRSPGNASPDVDSSGGYTASGSLAPAAAPRVTEWVCSDTVEEDPRFDP